MGEIGKYIGQLALQHLPFTILLFLFILSGFFKLTKHEVDPLGSLVKWVGKKLNAKVSEDVEALKTTTTDEFAKVKEDRQTAINKLKKDYEDKIADLRADIDTFETNTNATINCMVEGTSANCELLKSRLDDIEKSNDMQTAARIRVHVLNFAADLREGKQKTEEEYDTIVDEAKHYSAIVEKYSLENNKFKNAMEFIEEKNKECMRTGYAKYPNQTKKE